MLLWKNEMWGRFVFRNIKCFCQKKILLGLTETETPWLEEKMERGVDFVSKLHSSNKVEGRKIECFNGKLFLTVAF